MKKILALVLAVMMIVSVLAGCQTTTPSETGASTPSGPSTPATYTYNTATSVFPTFWNPHTYEESSSGTVLDYISSGFYSFDYNEDMTGFAMVPSMATGDPEDITSQYVGKFGIKEGDKELVWKVTLRNDLKWQNGDKITANDYVESAKRLLDPAARNYRADSMYSGDVVVYGAELYSKSGTISKELATTNAKDYKFKVADLVKQADGTYTMADGTKVYVGLKTSYYGLGSNTLTSYSAKYFTEDQWKYMTDNAVDNYVPVTDQAIDAISKMVGLLGADPAVFMSYDFTNPEYKWEDVGLFALSDTELVYVITDAVSGFYLKYGLPSGYLVHIPTYDACLKKDEKGNVTSTYCTSVETSMSYGPFKLINYELDKIIKFERNENYHGLEEGTYQTTHVQIDYVKEDTTRLNLFLSGALDVYGLTANDFAKYGKSDNTYYSEGASTFAITFNPNLDALRTAEKQAGENINKTIITLKEFRQAFCFGLDRPSFTAATDPAGVNAYGLFSNQHIVDPETGVGYRSTDAAKQVLVDFWGLAGDVGEGKLYANNDEAIASLTGYNPDQAKKLFDAAYDKAIAESLMDADDVVEIIIGMPSAESTFYNNGYNFLVNHYTNLVKGTKLEGKLTFKRNDSLGQEYNSALQKNTVDMLFGVGWSGMELNPYGLIMAYMTQQYQYDSATNYKQIDMTVKLDGVDYTTTVHNWYEIINGATHTITAADGTTKEYTCGVTAGKGEERLYILSQLERAVLLNYCFIPMNGDAGAQLKGMQLKYYTEEYMFGMGFGGIKYMTYHYTDAEWDAYVKANAVDGALDYT